MSIWDSKRIQMRKLSTTKFYDFSGPTTLVSVISPSEVIRIICLDMRKFNHNFLWIDYKVAQLFKIYIFCLGRFSIRGHLKNSNFKFEKRIFC
jgi:hypothetical protein